MSRVRLRDVAEAANVDISTVSRVLRGAPGDAVRPTTRQRILEAAAALDYKANAAAQSLKLDKTDAVALLLSDLANPAQTAIAAGAEARALASGYLLLLAAGSPAERLSQLVGRVDGVAIASATAGAMPGFDRQQIGIPMLLVNRREPWPVPSVTLNDEEAGSIATEHLIALGHRRIGHVAGPQNSDTGRRRRRGFVRAMERAGVEIRPEWVAEGSYNEAGGDSAARRILGHSERPTALLVSNLLASVGVLAAARRQGLHIPGELSIVAFDDVPLANYLEPAITTVRLPLFELGHQAIDALLAMIAGFEVNNVVVQTPIELVVRGSSVPPG